MHWNNIRLFSNLPVEGEKKCIWLNYNRLWLPASLKWDNIAHIAVLVWPKETIHDLMNMKLSWIRFWKKAYKGAGELSSSSSTFSFAICFYIRLYFQDLYKHLPTLLYYFILKMSWDPTWSTQHQCQKKVKLFISIGVECFILHK